MTTDRYLELVKDEIRDYNGFNYGVKEVIQVWYCKTIQNHKGLFIVKDDSGYIYPYFIEATYNGDEDELYLDFYYKEFKHTINCREFDVRG